MEKIFIIVLMNLWSNGEPEIIQYGTSILGESFSDRKACEARLVDLADGQNLVQERSLNGIVRANIVYRSRDSEGKVNQEYSCLEINYQKNLK